MLMLRLFAAQYELFYDKNFVELGIFKSKNIQVFQLNSEKCNVQQDG
jgi:hypothetical protein